MKVYNITGDYYACAYVRQLLPMWENGYNGNFIGLQTIKKEVEFKVESKEIDMLLFEFLEQLVIEKDANQLIFSEFKINIKELDGKYELYAVAKGEHIDYKKHELCADVKAVTLHKFSLTKEDSRWKATMVLDI